MKPSPLYTEEDLRGYEIPESGGSPFKIDELTGYPVFLSPSGTKPVTSEDIRKLLEDFP